MPATPGLEPIQARIYTRAHQNSATELARTVANQQGWTMDGDDLIYDETGTLIAAWIEDVADAMKALGIFSQENGELTGIDWSKALADDGQTLASKVRDDVLSKL